MKRVLVVSHGSALGGSPISALNIARQINPERFSVVFAFGEEGPIAAQARHEGYAVEIVDRKGFIGLASIARFHSIIRRHRIDLVHLNTLTSYYKYPALAARLAGKPIAWFVRENPEEKRCLRLRRFLRLLADKVVTVSYDTAAHMLYVPPALLATIHNGVDLDAFRPLPKEMAFAEIDLPAGNYITTIASLEQRKGVLDLIEAFAIARPELPDTKLLIVGADRSRDKLYEKLLHARIDDLGLGEQVVFYGESKDIQNIMAASRCFVLASYWEGLSRVLLEAMACGKPIIASHNGGNKEQVFDDINGFTFAAGDIPKLAELLARTADDELLERQGKASRQLAEEHFSILKTTLAIERLYDSLQ